MIKTEERIVNRKSCSEHVIEFCVELARRMVIAGANLERVDLAMSLICRAYGLEDVSIFLLSSHISLSAMDKDGNYISRQVTIPEPDINLEKLKSLNRLSFSVVRETPDAHRLPKMLTEASNVKEYSEAVRTVASVASMALLCVMFGGGVSETISTAVITFLLRLFGKVIDRMDINKLVGSSLKMCLATIATMLLYQAGWCKDATVVITTLCIMFIPGIPLTNAVRNLFCDHEMNGVLQTMKVLIQTAAVAAGIYVGVFILNTKGDFGTDMVSADMGPILVIALAAASTIFNAINFQVPVHDIWRVGVGAILTRIVLIWLPAFIPYRLVYTGIGTLVASLYAEYLARKRRDPSTYFVYPAMLPLIPGGQFFNMVMGFMYHDWSRALTNGSECALALLGMSLGFVISSSVAHYIRKAKADIHPTKAIKGLVNGVVKVTSRAPKKLEKNDK